MKSRLHMFQEPGVRGVLSSAGAAFAFYGCAMLAVAIFAQPLETDDAATMVEARATEPSASGPQARKAGDPEAPAGGERTVFRPETRLPARGETALPIDQR